MSAGRKKNAHAVANRIQKLLAKVLGFGDGTLVLKKGEDTYTPKKNAAIDITTSMTYVGRETMRLSSSYVNCALFSITLSYIKVKLKATTAWYSSHIDYDISSFARISSPT
jgi:hypothetical protein